MTIHRVEYYPQKLAERLEPTGAMISITSPGDVEPELRGWNLMLRLCFSDLERGVGRGVLFSASDAELIIAFLDSLPESVEELHIHCTAGVSRSVAVARFACQWYGVPFGEERGCTFNRLVYRRLVRVAGMEPIPEPFPDPDEGIDIVG